MMGETKEDAARAKLDAAVSCVIFTIQTTSHEANEIRKNVDENFYSGLQEELQKDSWLSICCADEDVGAPEIAGRALRCMKVSDSSASAPSFPLHASLENLFRRSQRKPRVREFFFLTQLDLGILR